MKNTILVLSLLLNAWFIYVHFNIKSTDYVDFEYFQDSTQKQAEIIEFKNEELAFVRDSAKVISDNYSESEKEFQVALWQERKKREEAEALLNQKPQINEDTSEVTRQFLHIINVDDEYSKSNR